MNVLVTGATSKIGRELLPLLKDAGHAVWAVSRRPNILRLPVERWIEADIRDGLADGPPIDAVIHLAARVPSDDGLADPIAGYFEENLLGTGRVVAYAARAGARRFVYASTIDVYASVDEADPLTEDFPTAPASSYGFTKLGGEILCRSAPMTAVVLRLGGVYGSGMGDERFLARLARALHRGERVPVYSLDSLLPLLHARDAAEAFARALSAPPGIYNVCARHHPTLAEFVAAAQAAGTPAGVVDLVTPRRSPYRRRFCIDHLAEAFGWEPRITIQEGIADVIA